MTVEQYFEDMGVIHRDGCEVCNMKQYKPRISGFIVWAVIDVLLLLGALVGGSIVLTHLIWSITP